VGSNTNLVKTIGIIGGMSWQSSLHYYQLINAAVNERLGGLHSAQILMYSVDFAPIEKLQHSADWDAAAQVLIDAARRLEAGGADFF
jgi:aspartate racemase